MSGDPINQGTDPARDDPPITGDHNELQYQQQIADEDVAAEGEYRTHVEAFDIPIDDVYIVVEEMEPEARRKHVRETNEFFRNLSPVQADGFRDILHTHSVLSRPRNSGPL